MTSFHDLGSIKEEINLRTEEDVPLAIKSEPQYSNPANMINHESTSEYIDNSLDLSVHEPKIEESPFKNIQIIVKEEVPEMDSVGVICHNVEVQKESDLKCTESENNVQIVIENCGTLTNGYDSDHQISQKDYDQDTNIKLEAPSDEQNHQVELTTRNDQKHKQTLDEDHKHEITDKEYNHNQMAIKKYGQDYQIAEKIVTNHQIVTSEDINHQVTVKQELEMDENVSYDYPNFDSASMDSEERDDAMTALRNVETCLEEDVDIKCENETESLYCHETIEEEEIFPPPDIKLESGLTVTDTHLTPSSSNTPLDTNKLLVMKIGKNKNGLPEIMLNPNKVQETFRNSYDPYLEGYKETSAGINDFQLNSITGNVLTLEQQALGLEVIEPITCHLCPKTFKSKYARLRHLKIHETLEKNIRSRINGITKSKITRKLNKKLKEQKRSRDYAQYLTDKPPAKNEGYKCLCGKLFQRRTRMESCLRTHNYSTVTGKCVSCLTCKKQFKNKHELEMHRKKMHIKKFPCKFCPTDYKNKNDLFKHLQIHQEVQLLEYKVISNMIQEKQVLQCVLCPQTYTELSELKTHVMLDHKTPYTCPHCKNESKEIADFIDHSQTKHPNVEGQAVLNILKAFSRLIQAWKCEECKQKFVEPDKLALHQMEKHGPSANIDTQFQCEHCRRVFVSQKALTSHKRVHHKSVSTDENNDTINGIMCLECRKMCKDITALTSHMRLHSPDRKFPCKFCDFRFATKEKRKAHAEIHTGDMRYVCFICEYQCSSERRLKLHKRTPKHDNMQQYLLTGKPLVQESTSKEATVAPKKKAKKKSTDDGEKTESPKKRKHSKSREDQEEEKESSSTSEENNSDAEETVACDICGEEFSSHKRMEVHKQDHPFIEILADGQEKPERIFFK